MEILDEFQVEELEKRLEMGSWSTGTNPDNGNKTLSYEWGEM